MLGQVPSIVVVPNDLPPKPLREFVDYATARRGQLNYANAGNGTSQTRGVELLKEEPGSTWSASATRGTQRSCPT